MDIIYKNLNKVFRIPLESTLTDKEKLKEILKKNIKKTIDKQHQDFIDDKALRVVNNMEIQEVNTLYVPFIRMKGAMDVDWSCVEILHDCDRQIDRYVGRTGKAFKKFDILIPIANLRGHKYDELSVYRYKNIDFKSIRDCQFIDMSENTKSSCFPLVPLDENEDWMEVQIERKMHDLADSISYDVEGITESEQECHKLTLDNEASGVMYYLPTVSFKYRYRDNDYYWDFLIDPEKHSKLISTLQFQDEEDREAMRVRKDRRLKAEKEAEEIEGKEKLKVEKEAKDRERREKLKATYIKEIEAHVAQLNDSNFSKEQRNVFLTAFMLVVLLCIIWAFIILIDNDKHWNQHSFAEVFSWLFSIWAISELLVVIFGDSSNSLLKKVTKVSDPSPELVKKIVMTKNILKRRSLVRWGVIIGSIFMIVMLQLLE